MSSFESNYAVKIETPISADDPNGFISPRQGIPSAAIVHRLTHRWLWGGRLGLVPAWRLPAGRDRTDDPVGYIGGWLYSL